MTSSFFFSGGQVDCADGTDEIFIRKLPAEEFETAGGLARDPDDPTTRWDGVLFSTLKYL